MTAEIASSSALMLAVLAEAVPVISAALAPPDATAENAAFPLKLISPEVILI